MSWYLPTLSAASSMIRRRTTLKYWRMTRSLDAIAALTFSSLLVLSTAVEASPLSNLLPSKPSTHMRSSNSSSACSCLVMSASAAPCLLASCSVDSGLSAGAPSDASCCCRCRLSSSSLACIKTKVTSLIVLLHRIREIAWRCVKLLGFLEGEFPNSSSASRSTSAGRFPFALTSAAPASTSAGSSENSCFTSTVALSLLGSGLGARFLDSFASILSLSGEP
mmetsp:Transcript_8465/g.31883  ORF Transcript_8465/g.31883 Transcript_8465/m.31883 type:complete len:222 (-) Transcript_8465:465-1130(-)